MTLSELETAYHDAERRLYSAKAVLEQANANCEEALSALAGAKARLIARMRELVALTAEQAVR